MHHYYSYVLTFFAVRLCDQTTFVCERVARLNAHMSIQSCVVLTLMTLTSMQRSVICLPHNH